MDHSDMIRAVFQMACNDAVRAVRRKDDAARARYHAVANALQDAYPGEVGAYLKKMGMPDGAGQGASE